MAFGILNNILLILQFAWKKTCTSLTQLFHRLVVLMNHLKTNPRYDESMQDQQEAHEEKVDINYDGK